MSFLSRIAANSLQVAWWQQVLCIAILATLYIYVCGAIGARWLAPAIGWSEGIPIDETVEVDSLSGQFIRWDANYYLMIAQSGYQPHSTEGNFFPLYPLIVRGGSELFMLPLLWMGMIVSWLCFVGSCLVLYQWVAIDFALPVARFSVIWLCVFPMSLFLLAFYAESLFLVTSLAALYFARRRNFILSGCMIALAGASRPQALLLAIPYCLEFWQKDEAVERKFAPFVIGGLVAPLGMLGYLQFLGWHNGTDNLWDAYQLVRSIEFENYTAWPWNTLFDGFRAAILGDSIGPDWFSRVLAWHDLAYTLLGLALAGWSLFHFRRPVSGYLVGGMMFLLMNHGPGGYALWSLPRYLLLIAPVYPALAVLSLRLPRGVRWSLVGISVMILGLMSAWFASGRWVA